MRQAVVSDADGILAKKSSRHIWTHKAYYLQALHLVGDGGGGARIQLSLYPSVACNVCPQPAFSNTYIRIRFPCRLLATAHKKSLFVAIWVYRLLAGSRFSTKMTSNFNWHPIRMNSMLFPHRFKMWMYKFDLTISEIFAASHTHTHKPPSASAPAKHLYDKLIRRSLLFLRLILQHRIPSDMFVWCFSLFVPIFAIQTPCHCRGRL